MIERDLWKRQTANITEYDQAIGHSFEGVVLQDISDYGQGEKSIATQNPHKSLQGTLNLADHQLLEVWQKKIQNYCFDSDKLLF